MATAPSIAARVVAASGDTFERPVEAVRSITIHLYRMNGELWAFQPVEELHMAINKTEHNGTFLPSPPRVTPDEATELMIHHLQMAEAYFQIAPGGPETRDELMRHMLRASYEGAPLLVASRAFFDVATAEYERMKKDD